MVTLPVIIFEPMTMLQRMAEVCVVFYWTAFALYKRKKPIYMVGCWIWQNSFFQLMEYSYLLDMADKTEDPYMRMVYACKNSFHVYMFLYCCYNLLVFLHVQWNLQLLITASWAISVYYAYQRTWKPFNPILGETYEMVNHGGITFLSEQVG